MRHRQLLKILIYFHMLQAEGIFAIGLKQQTQSLRKQPYHSVRDDDMLANSSKAYDFRVQWL